ncbi:MAG TPA: MFS transporter [Nitrospirota bacterium]|nr:MFS transporter [Nitrospirota bacterium]
MEEGIEKQVMRKLFYRITPLLIFLYVISYLDRVNVSFAALTMNKDIGLDPYTYGLGAGIFFAGYCIFEIPSNLVLAHVGARKWIARILFTWGLIACAMALVQGSKSFLSMRFLLGVAEAGYFPGVILYLTHWFPARYRARIVSRFMIAIPISLAVGAPVSTWIMQTFEGVLGYHGWQWLFIIEGIPAVLATFVVLAVMQDSPSQAKWLTADEKGWLERELVSDRERIAAEPHPGIWRAFSNPLIWLFGFVYFADTGANLGVSMFLPQIVKQQGYSTMQTGFISSIPYIFGTIGMLVIGYSSDRFKERKWHVIVSLLLITLGLGLAGLLGNTFMAIMMICLGAIGIMGCKGPFWPIPSAYLSGAGAAAGIALINSLGNLGGFFGPYIVGLGKQMTNSFTGGLYALALLTLAGAIVTFFSVKVAKK